MNCVMAGWEWEKRGIVVSGVCDIYLAGLCKLQEGGCSQRQKALGETNMLCSENEAPECYALGAGYFEIDASSDLTKKMPIIC